MSQTPIKVDYPIQELLKDINSKLDKIDEKFESKFEKVEVKLDKIEERIESYRRISRKHKIEESNLLEFKNKLIKVADSTLELEKITNEYEKVYLENVQKFENGAKKLSEMRKNSAVKLDKFLTALELTSKAE